MANPKHRWSKARTGKGSVEAVQAPLVSCPQCHTLTPISLKECSYYDNRKSLRPEA